MTVRRMPVAALALASALLLCAVPAAAQTPAVPPPAAVKASAATAGHTGHGQASACDPRVRQALAESAQAGVEAELAIIRDPDHGIRNPDSIFDFSCIWDLFDYSSFDIQFDPAGVLEEILDLARRRLCAAGRDAYRRYLGRALDPVLYTAPLPRLPGLTSLTGFGGLDGTRRNVLDDVGTDDAERFRSVVGGAR
ncbi:MAG: hypothetical protein OXO52_17310 [Rhodospirillales bacterium]|nr:hypothetical protein [Rhodospirillales bacterium]MDE0378504.1 hypothetical protein [Rhodospirillales bacterium]